MLFIRKKEKLPLLFIMFGNIQKKKYKSEKRIEMKLEILSFLSSIRSEVEMALVFCVFFLFVAAVLHE